ncbi:MAG: hypothetical protein GXO39_03045 [Thermotogae bacterium]|nr:hypothetical protein [Thermotogota bacterium]
MNIVLLLTLPGCSKGMHLQFARALSLKGRIRKEAFYRRLKKGGFDCVIIDFKTVEGYVGVPFDHPLSAKTRAVKGDLRGVADYLRGKGVYVIGRLAIFKDAALRRVIGRGRGEFVFPGDSMVEEYNISILKEVIPHVDEIQLDYIRWPDVAVGLPTRVKVRRLISSLKHLLSVIPDTLPTSADIFGRIPLQPKNGVDMIGQSIYTFSNLFDVLSPMAYPSHYWKELLNPYLAPYHTLLNMISFGIDTSRIRVWLQAFSWRVPKRKGLAWYIRRQLEATYDLGNVGYMFWLPRVSVLVSVHRKWLQSLPHNSTFHTYDEAFPTEEKIIDTLYRNWDVVLKRKGWILRYYLRSSFRGLKKVAVFKGNRTLLLYTKDVWPWINVPFNVVTLLSMDDLQIHTYRRNFTLYWRGKEPRRIRVLVGEGTFRIVAYDERDSLLAQSPIFPLPR